MKNKLRNFTRCCLKYGWYFVAELLLAYILSLVMVRGNTLIGDAIDTLLSGVEVDFKGFIVILLAMTALGFILAFLKSICISRFAIGVQTKYKEMVVKKLYHLEYKYFDKNSSASVINKVNSDIAALDGLLNQNMPEVCTNIVAMITYAVYVGSINWQLLVLIMVCYPVLFYFTNKVVRKLESLRKVFRQKSDIITEISQDCVSGIMVLRTFGAEAHFQEKLSAAADDLVDNEAKRTRISNNAILVRRMLQWLPNIICAVYAYFLVIKGNISLGELVVFLMILQKFVDAYIGIPFNFVDAKENLVCVKRVEEILCEEDEPCGTETTGMDTDAAITFNGVDFSYTEGKQVLSDLAFEIRKGSSVAFVGDSGGGKSTIFHLLCGFYRLDKGTYSLFGRPFLEWNIEAAREQFALVSQNVFLFPTTIRENVRYGNQSATDEEIVEACKKARIHEFIAGLPEGYDSIVGERGILLSGGERQRISMARAFLKNAPILLLDEPTSAVDVETESLIQEALDELAENRTCITIAHRLSTIKSADTIMVLKDGKIAESGTHRELIQYGGVYAGLYGKEENTHETVEDIY
ncbi:MAG: ABC transporter ATP-binding protein [Lachnospiraceae bacterium]|nr:ABC transporter ATP-binding protein [Lachnospiraceae bacterium]